MKPDARCSGLPRVTARSTVAVWLESCRGSTATAAAALAATSPVIMQCFIVMVIINFVH